MEYTLNNFRAKKFGKKHFVTTDHGSFCVLSDNEFRRLKQNNLNNSLIKKLEEKEIVLTSENIDEAVRLLRNRNNCLFSGTSLHIIVATLRCNMSCVYCHASSKPPTEKEWDMDIETAKKTVDFIFQSPSNSITIEFQGGEPLLNWETVKYITEYSREKNKVANKDLKVTVVTNLIGMDEEKMEFLIKNEVDICTSLDGPKELHDCNRKFAGGSSYEYAAKWIKRINKEYRKRKIKNRRVNALATLTKKSLNYPIEIVDEYARLGFNSIHLRFLNRLGVANKSWQKIGYTAEDYLKFWKKAVSYIENLNKKGKKINERMITIMLSKICSEFDPNFLDLRSPCGAAIGQLAYNYNGDIYTCDEARMIGDDLFLLGNVKKDSYKDILTSDKACAVVSASINDPYVCDACAYKPYCGVCPVCNYAEQGNVVGKITQTDRCKIFKEQFDWVVKNKIIG